MGFTAQELKSKRIGVLMGGLSTEREGSLRTGKACADALESKGYVVTRIDVQKDVARRLLDERVEVAFIALHGRWGEDGCIQGLLESMFIPYTGSGVLASAVGMDKVAAKQVFAAHGIPTPPSVVFPPARAESVTTDDLPFGLPCVVKPSGEGSSVGVHLVKEKSALAPASFTRWTPTLDPSPDGFTTHGRPNGSSATVIPVARSGGNTTYSMTGIASVRKSTFATTLSMPTAEASTPEPVYGMAIASRRPWMQPSSPQRPCSALKATSMPSLASCAATSFCTSIRVTT